MSRHGTRNPEGTADRADYSMLRRFSLQISGSSRKSGNSQSSSIAPRHDKVVSVLNQDAPEESSVNFPIFDHPTRILRSLRTDER
jgi:hypothetical protein